MLLADVIKVIKNNRLPNITTRVQMDDSQIIEYINEAVLALYTQFTIEVEQAIILVPEYRNIFRIHSSDENVFMTTIAKLKASAFHHDIKEVKPPDIKENIVKELDLDDISKYALDKNKEVIKEVTEPKTNSTDKEILQILDVTDNKNREYNFNTNLVFSISQDTLYFPEAHKDDIIYVRYKVLPKLYTIDDINTTFELPDTLLQCLYAFIDLRAITTIEGYKDFYPNLLNTYNQSLQNIVTNGFLLPDSMKSTLQTKKGFY